jgi:hypothetical protein
MTKLSAIRGNKATVNSGLFLAYSYPMKYIEFSNHWGDTQAANEGRL